MSNKRKVAITGIGLVTPLGNNTQTTWQNLIDGKSGISTLNNEKFAGYSYKIAGQVKNDQELLDKIFPANKQRKTARFIHLAVLAGHSAFNDAQLSQIIPENRERFGTCIGVGIGGVDSISQSAVSLEKTGVKRVSPFLIPKAIINQAAANLSMLYNLQGPTSSIVNACSSSGDAIGHAFRMIRDGYADYMLTGGSESSITPLSIGAFGNMRALANWKGDPQKACRPFDKDRCGFVMSEGAAILVLERMDLAQKRGAKIYAQVVGYGSTSDAFHITAMHPEGRGAMRAIEVALNDGKVEKEKIGYINAHGTSTPMNDPIETKVIKKVFGAHVLPSTKNHALVSSTKSMTGHMLGAAGGAEIAFTALALKNQIFPPTINLENPDPLCDLDYIANVARKVRVNNTSVNNTIVDNTCVDYAISNSFGFGGGNSVVVLKRV